MKMSEAFPSKWLSAGDFEEDDNGNPVDLVATIREVKLESLEIPGQPMVDKPVVFFEELEKGLVLNKTNGKTIAAMYGNDTDDWAGKPITLYATEVNFQGTMTPCVRIRGKAPKKAPKKPTLKSPPGELTPKNPGPLVRTGAAAKNDDINDDLPF